MTIKTLRHAIKFLVLLAIASILALGTYIIVDIYQETPPGNVLDFYDITKTIIDQPIRSIEEALPHAIKKAQEWRRDAILTQISMISIGEKNIREKTGRINYRFEFP